MKRRAYEARIEGPHKDKNNKRVKNDEIILRIFSRK